jgi:uncharacterized protein YdbL (DUF1318 family)
VTVARTAKKASASSPPSRRVTWLMLVYRVPTEPTRHRAAVWRRLRNMGAVYVQNSVAMVPKSGERERALRALRNEIVEKMDGKAYLLTSSAMAGEQDLIATVNAARDDEYEEILDKCRDFHAEIDKESANQHFTYGELEENEEDLHKLEGWFAKVVARDALGASKRQDVQDALASCARALEDFAAEVYAADTNS